MTYRTRSGRQFVVIATGSGPDATLTAFALGAGGRPTTTAAVAAAPGVARSGAEAYAAVCQSCHGPDGRGGLAPALVPWSRQPLEVVAIVREGVGQMPPVSPSELNEAEINAVVSHLRSLGDGRD